MATKTAPESASSSAPKPTAKEAAEETAKEAEKETEKETGNQRSLSATRTEELVFLFFTFWLMVGLCLDGWAHRHQPELESFFTPWHAVFYTGFAGGAAWVALMIYRRRSQTKSLKAAIPDGYQLAVVGLGLFAIGGIGDGIWHTIFGVEVAIDALLSPTHQLLLVGMLLAGTSPVRSAWRGRSTAATDESYLAFLPVTLSLALTTTGVAFFFLYANGFNNWPMTRSYEPDVNDVVATLGIFAVLASTLLLLFPVMLILRRWQPPFGTFLTIFGLEGIFMAGLDAFESPWQIIAPVLGGLTTDLILRSSPIGSPTKGTSRGNSVQRQAMACGILTPLVMWITAALALHIAWGIYWPPELWAGSIVLASLAGFALALVSHPSPVPSRAEL